MKASTIFVYNEAEYIHRMIYTNRFITGIEKSNNPTAALKDRRQVWLDLVAVMEDAAETPAARDKAHNTRALVERRIQQVADYLGLEV